MLQWMHHKWSIFTCFNPQIAFQICITWVVQKLTERIVNNSEYLNFRRAGNPGMRNSRSRPFPGMKPLIPSPELWEWSFSIPPRSRSFGMELSIPVPELPKVIPSHPCGNQTDNTRSTFGVSLKTGE